MILKIDRWHLLKGFPIGLKTDLKDMSGVFLIGLDDEFALRIEKKERYTRFK